MVMVSIDKSTKRKETRVIKKRKETSRQYKRGNGETNKWPETSRWSTLVQVREYVKREWEHTSTRAGGTIREYEIGEFGNVTRPLSAERPRVYL